MPLLYSDPPKPNIGFLLLHIIHIYLVSEWLSTAHLLHILFRVIVITINKLSILLQAQQAAGTGSRRHIMIVPFQPEHALSLTCIRMKAAHCIFMEVTTSFVYSCKYFKHTSVSFRIFNQGESSHKVGVA